MTQSIQIKRVKNGIEAIRDGGVPLFCRPGEPIYAELEKVMLRGRLEVEEKRRWKPRGGVDY